MQKVYNLADVTENQLGCWIDGYAMTASDFDIQLVETALHFGWDINVEDWKELKNQLVDYNYPEDIVEDLANVADEALDWLNIKLPDGYYLEIDASSLFLTHEDLELINE